MVRKRCEMVRKLPGNGLEMVRKWSVNGQEIVRTWSLNGQEMALLLDLSRQHHSCLFHEHIEGSFPRIIMTSSCVSRTISHSPIQNPPPYRPLVKTYGQLKLFQEFISFVEHTLSTCYLKLSINGFCADFYCFGNLTAIEKSQLGKRVKGFICLKKPHA